MTGYDACCLFLALNNHFFGEDYDFFKYKGKVTLKPASYEKKHPQKRYRYDRLAKKFRIQEELENFMVANMIESNKRMWVGSLFGGEADDLYLRWQGRSQALQYILTSEVKKTLDQQKTPSFDALFRCETNQHPEILKAQMRGDLSLETFVILNMILEFFPTLDKKLEKDTNWRIIRQKAISYQPFLERLGVSVSAMSKALQTTVQNALIYAIPAENKSSQSPQNLTESKSLIC